MNFAICFPNTYSLDRDLSGPIAQKVDSTIHCINLYPLDSTIGFPNTYPVDSDLSGG